MTLIGGHSAAGTPSPQGASWFSSTQLRAVSAPTMTSAAPVESETSLAAGAAPWMVSPVLSSVGRPAMMPATWVPWPPSERVSVSTLVRHVEHLAGGLERVAEHLVVADDGAGAVLLLEVGVGRVDAGVDQRRR